MRGECSEWRGKLLIVLMIPHQIEKSQSMEDAPDFGYPRLIF